MLRNEESHPSPAEVAKDLQQVLEASAAQVAWLSERLQHAAPSTNGTNAASGEAGDQTALSIEIDRLQQELIQQRELARESAQQSETLAAQVNELKGQLDRALEALACSEGGEEVVRLRTHTEELKNQVQRLTAQIEANGGVPGELETYERELHAYRDQLEQAQAEIEDQQRQLEERLRESELRLSRERADLYREKSNVDRIRQELHNELEHHEREMASREQLSSVKELQDEIKSQDRSDEPDETTFTGRLRGLLRRLG